MTSEFDRDRFPPVSRADMARRGWAWYDILIVTGDAYVDHPSFGPAVIGRVLEALRRTGRGDLIGYGKRCLVRPEGGQGRRTQAAPESGQAARSAPKTGKRQAKPVRREGWARPKGKKSPGKPR